MFIEADIFDLFLVHFNKKNNNQFKRLNCYRCAAIYTNWDKWIEFEFWYSPIYIIYFKKWRECEQEENYLHFMFLDVDTHLKLYATVCISSERHASIKLNRVDIA